MCSLSLLTIVVDVQSKKNTFADFQLFYLREKLIPCDQHQVSEDVQGFYWEPKGSRVRHAPVAGSCTCNPWCWQFAVMTKTVRTSTTFYQIEKRKITDLFSLDASADEVYWSPQGRFCVIAQRARMECELVGGG